MIKIINPEDFEGSPKYIFIQKGSSIAFLQKKFFSLKHEEVSIFHVEIVHDRSVNPNDDGMYGTGVLTGAVLGGFLGALFASISDPIKWDVDVMIWLHDERYVKATIKNEAEIKLLQQFMNTSQWDLDDYNERRQNRLQEEIKRIDAEQIEADQRLEQVRLARVELDWLNSINNELLQTTKIEIEDFLMISDSIDEIYWKNEMDLPYPTRTTLICHMLNFCVYLYTASDSKFTDSDAKIINNLFNKSWNSAQYISYADKMELNINNWGCKVPPLFELFVSLEKIDQNVKCLTATVEIHKMLSNNLMEISGRFGNDLNIGKLYIKRLERYLEIESSKTGSVMLGESASNSNPNLSCTECGYEARTEDTFCAGCGARFTDDDGRYAYYDHYDFYDSPEISSKPPYRLQSIPKTISAPISSAISNDKESRSEYRIGSGVIHKTFGKGVVQAVDGDIIVILFGNTIKKFALPACEEKGLLSPVAKNNANETGKNYVIYSRQKNTLSSEEQDALYGADMGIDTGEAYWESIDTSVDYGYMEDYGEDM